MQNQKKFSALPRTGRTRTSVDELLAMKFNGPGETKAEPNSLAMNSRNELATAIVTAAIFYMMVTVNVEKALAKWLPNNEGSTAKNGVDAFSNGIKYQDIVAGTGDVLQAGDLFEAECRLFYNGLELDYDLLKDNKGFNADRNIITVLQKVDALPFDGLVDGLSGLKVGGRRKIVLPPSFSFGEKGLSPYVPANASVLYDVKLVSILKRAEDDRRLPS